MRRFVLCAVVVALAAAPAWAHRVRVFAVAEGDRVLCNGFFAGGQPARDCAVTVETLGGKRLAEGRTDGEGNVSFQLKEQGDLKIVMHAGEGHGAEFILRAAERQAGPDASAPSAHPPAAAQAAPPVPVPADEARLRVLVREVVQEETLKLRRALVADLQRGPGFTEIAGGVGFIFGLTGFALYLRARHPRPGG